MLALLLESALRLLALGGVVWLGLSLLRVRNPHAQMTAWTVVLLASLSMPVLMRCVTVTIPAGPPPSQLAQIVSASLSLPVEATRSLGGTGATCHGAACGLGSGRHRPPFRRDIRCGRLAGRGDGNLRGRCRCAVAQVAHRPCADLASGSGSAAPRRRLGRRRGRARERCRRRAGDVRIDHPASPRLCRMELCEAAGRAGTRRLACCAW